MKKLLSLCSVLLALLIMISSMPVASAVFTAEYNYDNSFWVTLEAEETQTEEELEALLKVSTCYIIDKQTANGKIVYQLVAMNGEEPVEQGIERVKVIEGVTQAGRNVFANDYGKKESYLTLNQTVVEIPVGGTATLKITDTHLVSNCGYGMVGTMVEVDHNAMPFEQFQDMLKAFWDQEKDLQVISLALYEDDVEKNAQDHYLLVLDKKQHNYSGYDPNSLFLRDSKGKRLNTQSPIGKYIIDISQEVFLSKWQLLQELAQNEAIKTARFVYEPLYFAYQPCEEWSVENYKVAAVAVENGDENNQFYTATVVGKQVGETVLTVKHVGGSQVGYATCTVKVVENTTTQTDVVWGDVNNDQKVDAKDALQVLKYAVQKAEFTAKEQLAAEVTGDQKIDAKDALEMLKYSVGKIEQFPIEKVTPTDVTPTNQ